LKGGDLVEDLQLFEDTNLITLVAYLESNKGYVWLRRFFITFAGVMKYWSFSAAETNSLSKHLI